MITHNMRLYSLRDARQWASEFANQTSHTDALARWIWDSKPAVGCTWSEHPISKIANNEDDWWDLLQFVEEFFNEEAI